MTLMMSLGQQGKKMKKILVLGAGGFIGGAMMKRLKDEGYWVRGVDLKEHEFFNAHKVADEFIVGDLRDPVVCDKVVTEDLDEIYQFAADMGGAGFVFTGENDADIMHNSAMINLNIAEQCVKKGVKKVFYSSSACMYPERNQLDPDNPNCKEDSAYPAAPDSEYGWEKLFSERLWMAFARNHGLNVKIARYHNIFGPEGTWDGGREKAPAAFCRKVALAANGEAIEVWGDGKQTRSFLFIDECIEASRRLMDSKDFNGPVNIGSEEMIAINDFAKMAIHISGKDVIINNIQGQDFFDKYGFPCPVGVKGRNSDNTLIREKLNWDYQQPLLSGMKKTYEWISDQIKEIE
jgi:GDP-D-mannose 3',5'-epimerase|tara:strand:- start:8557 stop:9603 length:1047 start_codon:yes stop_codon:yes gene_type:complete